MGDRPVTAVWGIGDRTARRLADAGVHTVVELARADHAELARRFGPRIGPHLRVLALGGDDAPVTAAPHVARSRSREVTFEHDLADPDEIAEHVRRLAVEVTELVVADGRRVTHVAVKLRTSAFFTRSKISKLAAPTTDPDEVATMAAVVLDRFANTRAVRLLGVRVDAGDPRRMTSQAPGSVVVPGDVAQLVAHRLCKAGVEGSSPFVSTSWPD